MKIVMIHGQNHKGSSYSMGQTLLNDIKSYKEKVTEFFLPRDCKSFCLGCYNCLEDQQKCPFDKQKSVIAQAMEEADLLIFTTPTYCMHASAGMKNFLDLFFDYCMPHKPHAAMFSKRAVILSAAAGAGSKRATKDIEDSLFMWGISDIIKCGVSVSATNWQSVNEKRKESIQRKISRIAKKIDSGKRKRTSLKVKGFFYLMRLSQEKNMGSHPSERVYWQENGWLGKKRPWKNK